MERTCSIYSFITCKFYSMPSSSTVHDGGGEILKLDHKFLSFPSIIPSCNELDSSRCVSLWLVCVTLVLKFWCQMPMSYTNRWKYVEGKRLNGVRQHILRKFYWKENPWLNASPSPCVCRHCIVINFLCLLFKQWKVFSSLRVNRIPPVYLNHEKICRNST
jgi:hypothetical protein